MNRRALSISLKIITFIICTILAAWGTYNHMRFKIMEQSVIGLSSAALQTHKMIGNEENEPIKKHILNSLRANTEVQLGSFSNDPYAKQTLEDLRIIMSDDKNAQQGDQTER